MCGCLSSTHPWAPSSQASHIPWLGIKLANLWFAGQHSIHWATPLRAELAISFFFLNFFCYSITVVCLFSPSLHPTPAEPTSHLCLSLIPSANINWAPNRSCFCSCLLKTLHSFKPSSNITSLIKPSWLPQMVVIVFPFPLPPLLPLSVPPK